MRNWLLRLLRRPVRHHLHIGDRVVFRGAECVITRVDMRTDLWDGDRITFDAIPAIGREVTDVD